MEKQERYHDYIRRMDREMDDMELYFDSIRKHYQQYDEALDSAETLPQIIKKALIKREAEREERVSKLKNNLK